MYADAALDVAGGVLYALVQELVRVDALDAELVGDDAGREHVLELQVRLVQGGVVETVHRVARQQIRGPGGEVREDRLLELRLRHVVLALLVPDRLPLSGETTEYHVTVPGVFAREGEQSRHIDEHVVVGLEEILDLGAVTVDPLQRRDGLQREIRVRVEEATAYHVVVYVLLLAQDGLDLGIGGGAEHEEHAHVAALAEVAPRLPDRRSRVEMRRRGHYDHDQFHALAQIRASLGDRHRVPGLVYGARGVVAHHDRRRLGRVDARPRRLRGGLLARLRPLRADRCARGRRRGLSAGRGRGQRRDYDREVARVIVGSRVRVRSGRSGAVRARVLGRRRRPSRVRAEVCVQALLIYGVICNLLIPGS